MDKTTWPAFPARRGVDLGDEVWLSPYRPRHDETVTFHVHRIYRAGTEIGTIDYQVCHACRTALIGELDLSEQVRRHGIGTRVLDQLRRDLPNYRWAITPEKPAARPFWDWIRAAHPGEYGLGGRPLGCAHLLF
ncbi:hypothetical protein [Amycolatopsis sp. NPDC051071]|uniref:hypothetical protein n=1 Tax=Amycolatopsis sp. NPDC051071 TaxID=3154637 RepID=UPI00342C34CF